MKSPHCRGVTLIEVLLVVSISAILMAGAAMHFRSLRQASDVAQARREALQNARVALDRMARYIRAAKAIADISSRQDVAGSITITDFDDANHVFALQGSELHYGIDSADSLLASGVQALSFQGFDAAGEVPENEPERIEAVQVTLTVAIPGTSGTFDLATRTRLRRQVATGGCRMAMSYTTSYRRHDAGLPDYSRVFGAPDGDYTDTGDEWGARFDDFEAPAYTGTVYRIQVGFYLRHISGEGVEVEIKRGGAKLLKTKYTNIFEPYDDEWGWWWIDITDTRSSWTHSDVGRLEVKIKDERNGRFALDSVAVRTVFDEPDSTFFWADQEGGPGYDKEWLDADEAFGAPDASYATGKDDGDCDKQSYGISAEAGDDEILAVQACINGYVASKAEDKVELRVAPSDESSEAGIKHELKKGYLKGFVGQSNQGDMIVDVTGDYRLTWSDLNNLEIRIRVATRRNKHLDIKADAVGWRVIHASQGGGKGVSGWSE